jgi:hypothetical protein
MGTPRVLSSDSTHVQWVEEPDALTFDLSSPGIVNFTLSYAQAIPTDATPQYLDLLIWTDPSPVGANPPAAVSLNGYHEDGNSFTWPSQSPSGVPALPVSGGGMGFLENHPGVRFRQLFPFPFAQRAFAVDGMALWDTQDSRFTVIGMSVIRGYTTAVLPPPPPPPSESKLTVGGYTSGYRI